MTDMRTAKIIRLLLTALLALVLAGCNIASFDKPDPAAKTAAEAACAQTPAGEASADSELWKLSLTRTPEKSDDEQKASPKKKKKKSKEETSDQKKERITEDGIYHDLESVVLYYDKFGKLPSNFITKKEAKELGWDGGELNPYRRGASIGGDHFGNYEKRLPTGKGIKYIECDIDTNGGKRGAKRLIISNDGRYYYTADHYDSFREVVINDGKVGFLN